MLEGGGGLRIAKSKGEPGKVSPDAVAYTAEVRRLLSARPAWVMESQNETRPGKTKQASRG